MKFVTLGKVQMFLGKCMVNSGKVESISRDVIFRNG